MCGLLTFVSAKRAASSHREAIAEALEHIHHRGPDETKIEVVDQSSDDAVLGFKRLSIIDVEGSHQPINYADGRYVMTYNGEVYNYIELRDELIREHGAQFATDGDSEVVVAAYHYWGEQAVSRLRGMFAFVIWDTVERQAFGARDRFGIKPLYYLSTEDGVYFASEKKELLPFAASASAGDDGVDLDSLSHYVTFQYVPDPRSLHRGIARLGGGECFRYSPGSGIEVSRYWKPSFKPTKVDNPNALYQDIQDALRDSVRVHMRSDVPVGAFLSSGIDSTAIVALARELNPNILTFTAATEVAGYSELGIAEESARALDVTNYPVLVTPQMMMDALPRIMWHLDDPVADPSLIPLYYVAKKAAEHVTVVLSGEGSDEFFAGYPLYREPLSLKSVANLPKSLQKGLRAISAVVPEGVKGKGFVERGTTPIEQRHVGNGRIFTEQEKRTVLRQYDPSVRPTDITGPLFAEASHLDDVTKMQYVDLYVWLRGDILAKADRMSMAHSLELRVPFLDSEVFDVAARVPTELKVPRNTNTTKYALRQALAGVVPSEIVNRPKLGFPTPTRVWLKNEMYTWARDIFAGSGAGALINLPYAAELLEAHHRGDADHSKKIWTLLAFCVWYAVYVDHTIDPGLERNQSALITKPVVQPALS